MGRLLIQWLPLGNATVPTRTPERSGGEEVTNQQGGRTTTTTTTSTTSPSTSQEQHLRPRRRASSVYVTQSSRTLARIRRGRWPRARRPLTSSRGLEEEDEEDEEVVETENEQAGHSERMNQEDEDEEDSGEGEDDEEVEEEEDSRRAEDEALSETSSTSSAEDETSETWASYFVCKRCGVHLALAKDLVSKGFRGTSGKAYLLEKVINYSAGPQSERALRTGRHLVADIFCTACGHSLGWKYIHAFDPSQRYKINKFILEKALITKAVRVRRVTKPDEEESENEGMSVE